MFPKPLYYVRDVKDHLLNKERILKRMSQFGEPFDDGYDKDPSSLSHISRSDWEISTGETGRIPQTDWFQYAFSERDRNDYIEFCKKEFKVLAISTWESWYNQYDACSGALHNWHNHHTEDAPNDYANVYYVELNDQSLRTVLIHPTTGKPFHPEVKEGQILIFDAKILHMSPPNHTDTRKSSIAFNIALKGSSRK